MSWTAPVFTEFPWQDSPSVLTALDAANLDADQMNLAAYAVTIGQSVLAYIAAGNQQIPTQQPLDSSTNMASTAYSDLAAQNATAPAPLQIGDSVTNLGASQPLSLNIPETWLVGVINANLTIPMSNLTGGCKAVFLFTMGGSGGYTVTVTSPTTLVIPLPSTTVGAKCRVTVWVDDAGVVWAEDAVVIVPSTGAAPVNTVAPAITGTLTVGDVLTCSQGTWTGSPTPTYAYQWTQDGTAIIGATASTYTSVSGDATHVVGCVVTATNTAAPGGVTATVVGGTIAGGGGGSVTFLGDFSNVTVTTPIQNPTLSPTQWSLQEGNYRTGTVYPFPNQILYSQSDLPSGIPAHPRITTPVLALTTNNSDAGATLVTAPYDDNKGVNNEVATACNTTSGIYSGLGLLYTGYSFLFPSSGQGTGAYPTIPKTGFQQFSEIFSSPFDAPLHQLSIEGPGAGVPAVSQESFFYSTGSGSGNYPWTAPFVRGSWVDFVLGINFSTTSSGYVNLWMNGVLQTFNGSAWTGQPGGTPTGLGTTTLHFVTAPSSGASGAKDLYIANYRTLWAPSYTTLYVCGVKVGTTYASVAP